MGDPHEGSGQSIQAVHSVEVSDCSFASSFACGVRYLILAKHDSGTNLSGGDSAALKRLEDSTLSVSDLLKEKADSLILDPRCQLTIQIKRENLSDVQDGPASSEFAAEFDSPDQRLRRIENISPQGQTSTEEDSSDIDLIQRRNLALVPTGMEEPAFL